MTKYTLQFQKSSVTILLASIFALAFIISPTWMVTENLPLSIFILILSTAAGGIWAYITSSHLDINLKTKGWVSFVLLLIPLFAVNFNSLNTVIPWRGDEEYHIKVALKLVTTIPVIWGFLAPVFVVIFLITTWKKPKWAMMIGTITIIGAVFVHLWWNPLKGVNFLRYPFINYWFYAIAPLQASLVTTPYREILYRIIPFLSSVTIVWMVYQRLPSDMKINRYFWGFAAGTLPLMFYYASIFYLELPALLLMTYVCFHIDHLLNDDYENIKQSPAWYALILIGFIKDQTIIFLLCFLACRYVFTYFRFRTNNETRENMVSLIVKEISIAFSVLGPVTFYLFLRNSLTNFASSLPLEPQISNLWDISIYSIISQAFIEQFGLFLILFFGGIILLIHRKAYREVAFLLFVFVGIPLSQIVVIREISGYSRYNLYLLAPIFTGSVILIESVAKWNKVFHVFLIGATLSVSFLFSPINMDGTKKPFWGNYLIDTSEHYYPYDEVLYWLGQTHRNDKILFSGLYYDYFFEFYFNRLGWEPRNDVMLTNRNENQNTAFARTLSDANDNGFEVIVYHVTSEDIPEPTDMRNFVIEKIIKNQAHTLVIYTRDD